MNRKILKLAIPNIISNITVPLLGMVDLAIVGRIGGGELLAGIAIGTAVFNLLYWNFSFLRMGTSGFTSQAYGRRDFGHAFRTLFRALTISTTIALILIALQVPIEWGTMAVMKGSASAEGLAAEYFRIRIWAAPATLGLYAVQGWFIGMQNSKTPMWISIIINIANVVGSIGFAVLADMGLRGVAVGTVIAQWSGLLVGLYFLKKYYGRLFQREFLNNIFCKQDMWKFFKVNSNIFIRTICLVTVFTFFTSASSAMGDLTLSVNTLMLQLFILFSYVMDGFAYSGEALAGRYYGASNMLLLKQAIKGVFVWGSVVAVLFTLIYAVAGEAILGFFTDDKAVIELTSKYIWWAVAVPGASFAAFLMDGILIGVSKAAVMRNVMIVSSILFFGLYYSLTGVLGNDALWAAFILYLLGRGVGQLVGISKIYKIRSYKFKNQADENNR